MLTSSLPRCPRLPTCNILCHAPGPHRLAAWMVCHGDDYALAMWRSLLLALWCCAMWDRHVHGIGLSPCCHSCGREGLAWLWVCGRDMLLEQRGRGNPRCASVNLWRLRSAARRPDRWLGS